MGGQSTITKAHSYNRAAATPRPPFTLLHHPTHRAQCSPLTRISLQRWLPPQTTCSWRLGHAGDRINLTKLVFGLRSTGCIAAAFGNARHAIRHCTFPASQPGQAISSPLLTPMLPRMPHGELVEDADSGVCRCVCGGPHWQIDVPCRRGEREWGKMERRKKNAELTCGANNLYM